MARSIAVYAPPFPATAILDSFTRADSTTTLGASWSLLANFAGTLANQGIVSNQAYNPTAQFANYSAMYWNATTYGPHCECYMTISTRPSNDTDCPGLYMCVSNPGTINGFTGYVFGMNLTAGTINISRNDVGNINTVLTSVSQVISSGDKILFRKIGSTLYGYVFHSNAWTLAMSATDATYSSGYAGMYFPGNQINGRYDDFGGGNLTGRSTATNRTVVRDYVTSLLFNGTSNKVASSLWSSSVNNITMSCRFKTLNYQQSNQVIISNGEGTVGHRGFALVISGNSTTDGSMYILDHLVKWVDLGFKIQDNNWHHILLTIDGSNNVFVYVDGVLRFTSGTQSLATPTTASYIGSDGGTQFFYGYIDDPRFYTTYLDATASGNLYRNIEYTTAPTNWYKFDEGSGTTATDSGSAAKTGTITGAIYSTVVPSVGRTLVS